MRRAGNLHDKIVAWDNLRLAFRKASRGRRLKNDVMRYRSDLDEILCALGKRLAHPENLKIGEYRFFTIYDPKERVICEAPFTERVLHHAVMNILEDSFESFQIHDSYACRKGKGTDAALKRALYFARRNPFFLKLDVIKYFDSISHDTLKALLARRFKDRKVLSILESIIDSYHINTRLGIPIGNLSSQFFANFYLGFLDHFITEELKIGKFIR
jgi:RNA-directed DNA polymerase